MIQGSEEWRQARCGLITASRVADLMAKTKSGYSTSRKNYVAELLVERLTGIPTESFTNTAMQWGTDHEPEARAVYEFESGDVVEEVGFIVHPNLPYTGASPDGLVDFDGMVEIKCPNTATHIETLITGKIPGRYITQMQGEMECCGRQWCDYVSFDPRIQKQSLVLFVQRVFRDQAFIDLAIKEVMMAEMEIQELMSKLGGDEI